MAAAHGVAPRWIVHTHGHADHTGGTRGAARAGSGAQVLGHGADAGWFAPDEDLAGRAELALGGARGCASTHAPGHTPGSVLLEWRGRLLTGDTLFWGGCGNCRHGGDPRRWRGACCEVVGRLDGALEVHPGHDYAEANLPFALELEPGRGRRRDAARRRCGRRGRPGEEPAALDAGRGAGDQPVPAGLGTVEAVVALRARRDDWSAPLIRPRVVHAGGSNPACGAVEASPDGGQGQDAPAGAPRPFGDIHHSGPGWRAASLTSVKAGPALPDVPFRIAEVTMRFVLVLALAAALPAAALAEPGARRLAEAGRPVHRQRRRQPEGRRPATRRWRASAPRRRPSSTRSATASR